MRQSGRDDASSLLEDFGGEETDLGNGKAILVALQREGESSSEVAESLDELARLADTLGVETPARLVQARNRISAAYFIGKGKAEALARMAKEFAADLVLFDDDLSPAQLRNLEKTIEVTVMDRCGVILEIFSRHARTYEAKIQVELARLEYLLPRLRRRWTHLSRQRGGTGTRLRGGGETQIEADRRSIRDRISHLKKKLGKIAVQRQTQRAGRSEIFRVALVGYTNCGKSTLLNTLTESDALVADKLFATLDPRVRHLRPPEVPRILVTDTVGFIRKLPHSLVASFKSTLEEVHQTDLLIEVVDLSHRLFEKHRQATEEVLDDLELGGKPRILVFNKIDALKRSKMPAIVRSVYPSCITTSALTGEGVDELKEAVLRHFDSQMVDQEMQLDYCDGRVVSEIFDGTKIDSIEYLEEGIRVRFRATRSQVAKIHRLMSRDGGEAELRS